MDEVADLKKHIETLKIYPVFQNYSEKDSLTALQFLCIVDYHMNVTKLYDQINKLQQPKLLGNLLQFKNFETFTYVHYKAATDYGNYILECKHCELIGPCGYILTHLAINHHEHVGVVMCLYCKEQELKNHIKDNSLAQCHTNYCQSNEIVIDEKMGEVVANFYKMLKTLSEKLNLCSTHEKNYRAVGYASQATLPHSYGGDISRKIEVRNMMTKTRQNRSIQSKKFAEEFQRIMDSTRGGNYKQRFSENHSDDRDVDVIVINGSDEDGDENAHALPVLIPGSLIKCELKSMCVSPTPTVSMGSIPNDRRLSIATSRHEDDGFAWNIQRRIERIPQGTILDRLKEKIKSSIYDAENQKVMMAMMRMPIDEVGSTNRLTTVNGFL